MKPKLLTVAGARPQFVKASALSRAIDVSGALDEVLIHTGQHADENMSAVFFDELGIRSPKHNLGLAGGHAADMVGRMLPALAEVVRAENPDAVVVYGDTNSTLAGALAGAMLHLPVIHIEAGMRSFDRQSPEELNRIVTDRISSLWLCASHAAVAHLRDEGIRDDVHHVGDLMYDAVLFARAQLEARSNMLAGLNLKAGTYAVATLHRAETVDDTAQLTRAIDFLRAEARRQPVVFPLHPRTRKAIHAARLDTSALTLVEPAGYFDMQALIAGATLVFTDSGGLQKEAYFHRKPCVTLRDVTEWTETVDAGWNRLWTVVDWSTPRRDIPDFGTGDAGARCVSEIVQFLERTTT